MAFQQPQTQDKEQVETEDESKSKWNFSDEDVSLFYNVATTVVAQVDPNSSEGAKALVEACSKMAAIISEKGNVSEAGDAPTNV